MKTINLLFISLFLISGLLLWAGDVFAAACSSSCSTLAPGNCECGNATPPANRSYCYENQIFDGGIDGKERENAQARCRAVAASLSQPPENFSLPDAPFITGQGLLDRINTITNWVFAIFLAISIIYIVIAAFQFVTGGGKPEEMNSARQKLIYAAIGIAIALLAKALPIVIRNIVIGGA